MPSFHRCAVRGAALCALLGWVLGCASNEGSSGGGSTASGGTAAGVGGVGASTGGAGTGGIPGSGGGGGSGTGGTTEPVPNPTITGDVVFSTPSQSFRDALEVGMSTDVSGAEIRYTTDGTLPTASSMVFSGTIQLTATTELRAQPFVAGAPAGQVGTALYIARTFDLTSDLPIILVDGYGGGKPENKDVSLRAAFMLFEPTAGAATLTALPNVATRAGYHVRGQSSANFPQTPYKIELWDNEDNDADYSLVGLPADSDWALIPPYYDRSLVRNPFVYELGRAMGLQAPRWAYAEVYLNYEEGPVAEDDYQGIYWLSETIKNNAVRTNLKQLKPEDTALPAISGGYIFKFDQAATEEPTLTCTGSEPIAGGFGGPQGGGGTCWVDLEVVDPEPLNTEQQTWLTSHIQGFHDLLHATPIGDYGAYMDVPSFVDYLIVNELTRNVDSYVRSAFYHKDRDGKITAGPLWDYNFSLAIGGPGGSDPDAGFMYDGTRNVNNWYPKLTDDPAFMTAVKTRWKEVRQGLLSNAAMEQRITELAAPLQNAITHDFGKWPVSTVYQPCTGFCVVGPTDETWQAQVDAMRTWVTARAAWLDTQYSTP